VTPADDRNEEFDVVSVHLHPVLVATMLCFLTWQHHAAVGDHAAGLEDDLAGCDGAAGDHHGAAAENHVVAHLQQIVLHDLQPAARPVHALAHLQLHAKW
jgi:hypothetical protein